MCYLFVQVYVLRLRTFVRIADQIHLRSAGSSSTITDTCFPEKQQPTKWRLAYANGAFTSSIIMLKLCWILYECYQLNYLSIN